MTEGPPLHHDKPMCVRIWLEVGHECEPRRSSIGRSLVLDWRVWVRGASGHDISTFVHKVVYYLHPSSAFVYPKRVLQEPPYEIQESGCASIEIPIHVYLKYSTRPKKIRLRYSLQIENNKYSTDTRCIYYDLENPSEQLCKALMMGGGEVVARTGGAGDDDKLVVLLPSDTGTGEHRPHRLNKAKKYRFIEPIQCKHGPKRRTKSYIIEETCSKCGELTNIDLRKHLRAVSMTDEDISLVSQLYLSKSSYEKSDSPLELPSLSDPRYMVPELSKSLRDALKSCGDSDYTVL